MTEKNYYYDLTQIDGYDRVINFIMAARGIGKTYGIKLKFIKRFINKQEQFVYLRRNNKQIEGKKLINWYEDIPLRDEFKGHTFTRKGKVLYIDKQVAGYVLALSTFTNEKSVPYPLVHNLVYDEFVPERNERMLTNEPLAFDNLIHTIFRKRECKIYLTGNSVTKFDNPYFNHFNIRINPNSRFTCNKYVCIDCPPKSEFAATDEENLSPLEKILRNTSYGSYAFDNVALDEDTRFIAKHPNGSVPMITIRRGEKDYTLWRKEHNKYTSCYLEEGNADKSTLHVASKFEDATSKIPYIGDTSLQEVTYDVLTNARNNSSIFFSNGYVRSVGSEILKDLRII